MAKSLLFYTYPSCTSCRKTKKWLRENEIEFEERHLFKQPPTVTELKQILTKSTKGIEDILAKRSQTFKQLEINIELLSLTEMLELLQKEPKLLRRPIMVDDDSLVIGYDRERLSALKRQYAKPAG